jgi:hypothetical protein
MNQYRITYQSFRGYRVTCVIKANNESEAIDNFHQHYTGAIITIEEVLL